MKKINQELKEKGLARQRQIADLFREKGFLAYENRDFNAGVDLIIVTPEGKIIQVIEVTNYKRTTWMPDVKAKRYANNLQGFPFARKTVSIIYPENIKAELRQYFREKDIEVTEGDNFD